MSAYAINVASDKEQLIKVITEAENNTGKSSKTILADSGYASYENYEQLHELNKTILIPDLEKHLEGRKAEINLYYPSYFEYDQTDDAFICPEGKPLPFNSMYSQPLKKQKGKMYQGTECKDCTQKECVLKVLPDRQMWKIECLYGNRHDSY